LPTGSERPGATDLDREINVIPPMVADRILMDINECDRDRRWAFMKIPHRPSMLTNHLADMRKYMPAEHRQLIETVEAMPSVREFADRQPYNAVLDAIADFRTIHYGWAQEYINRWTDDPRGTGGTPYMDWLQQLIEETRSFKIV
jgi:indoleamine 2,3-dioxygenase